MKSVTNGSPTVPWRAVIVFILVSMLLAWLISLPLWMNEQGLSSAQAIYLLPVLMLSPAVATCIALAVQRSPRRTWLPFLGVWPLRPTKRIVWTSLVAIPAAFLLVATGVLLSSSLGLVELDLATFSGYVESVRSLGISDLVLPAGALIAIQLAAIPLNAVISLPFALGEELGWRGWLLPSLLPLGTWPALLLTGFIWGLWHSPIILLGYNYGLTHLSGVLLMTVACMLLGILLGWLRLRTGSIWPAVVAHSTFNASAGVLTLVLAAGESPDPISVGPLGWVAWIVMAIVVCTLILTGQMRKDRLTNFPAHDTLVTTLASQSHAINSQQINLGDSRS